MAYEVIWAPSARFDLAELASYIRESRPQAAARFIRGVLQTVECLVDFPESGRMVPEFDDPGIREVIRRPCRIVYRIQADKHAVEIVRVWHAARGVPEL